MANVRAFRSGLWSDTNPATSPWGTGGVLYAPNSADDVFSNSFTIHVDTDVNVISVTNGSATSRLWKDGATTTATVGGTFNLFNNVTLSGIIRGSNSTSTNVVVLTGSNSGSIVGSILGTNENAFGSITARNLGTGTLNVVGTVIGGASIQGGTNTLVNNNVGSMVITGSITGSTGTNNTPTLVNNSTGTINVIGDITSALSYGFSNGSTGQVSIIGNLIAGGSIGAYVSTNANAINRISGNIINAPNGIAAIYAASYFINPIPTNGYIRYARNGTGIGSDAYLFQYTTDSLSAFSMPPISAVRLGTTFANGTLTGTCAMPEPQSVAYGVVYDNNSVGTAALSPQNIFSAEIPSLTATNSIGVRLKNAATTENVGKLIASFNP